jgi:type IX secretion system PorP/SprF family membrane protein
MKQLFILFIALFSITTSLFAQGVEEGNQLHYAVNPVLINPAATGFYDQHQIFMNMRAQWVGFSGAPQTYNVSYNGPVGDKIGIGGFIMSENIASMSRYRTQLNYSFRMKLQDVKMAIGLSTGFENNRLAASIRENTMIQQNDDVLSGAIDGSRYFDATAGVFGVYQDKLTFGFHTPLSRVRLGEIAGGTPAKDPLLSYYTVMAGYKFAFPDANVVIEPMGMIRKMKNVPFQIDASVRAAFLDGKFIGGMCYRTEPGGSLGFLLGTRFKPIDVYYSYDFAFSKFQRYNSGSHELTVSIAFDRKNKSKYDTPTE